MNKFPEDKCGMPFLDSQIVERESVITDDQYVLHIYEHGNLDIIFYESLSPIDPVQLEAERLERNRLVGEIIKRSKSKLTRTRLQQKIAEIAGKEQ